MSMDRAVARRRERLDVEDGGLEARKLTRPQLRSVKSLWERSSEPRYREFRRRVMPLIGLYSRAHGGWVTVQWAGINLTIDPQGYTYVRGAA